VNVTTLKWPNLLIVHWVLNPGVAFNEVFLGQRLPAVSYYCRDCRSPLVERSWLECPHCNSTFSAKLWQGRTAFGHWLGVVCPGCGGIIPSLWNHTSLLLLALTAPIWWFLVRVYREPFLDWERHRIRVVYEQQLQIRNA
jgi:hypothetical protein